MPTPEILKALHETASEEDVTKMTADNLEKLSANVGALRKEAAEKGAKEIDDKLRKLYDNAGTNMQQIEKSSLSAPEQKKLKDAYQKLRDEITRNLKLSELTNVGNALARAELFARENPTTAGIVGTGGAGAALGLTVGAGSAILPAVYNLARHPLTVSSYTTLGSTVWTAMKRALYGILIGGTLGTVAGALGLPAWLKDRMEKYAKAEKAKKDVEAGAAKKGEGAEKAAKSKATSAEAAKEAGAAKETKAESAKKAGEAKMGAGGETAGEAKLKDEAAYNAKYSKEALDKILKEVGPGGTINFDDPRLLGANPDASPNMFDIVGRTIALSGGASFQIERVPAGTGPYHFVIGGRRFRTEYSMLGTVMNLGDLASTAQRLDVGGRRLLRVRADVSRIPAGMLKTLAEAFSKEGGGYLYFDEPDFAALLQAVAKNPAANQTHNLRYYAPRGLTDFLATTAFTVGSTEMVAKTANGARFIVA